jgi:hypothetical protein
MLWETKYAMPYLVIHIVPTVSDRGIIFINVFRDIICFQLRINIILFIMYYPESDG